MEQKKNTFFTSRWGFILSAVGSAVGMANVWGFPAKMGANGGGAFLVAYLFFIVLFSTVGLSAEYAIGRRSRTGTVGSYRKAWESRTPKLGNAGGLLGWLPLAGSMCIAIGYAVIIAYVLKAFFVALSKSQFPATVHIPCISSSSVLAATSIANISSTPGSASIIIFFIKVHLFVVRNYLFHLY